MIGKSIAHYRVTEKLGEGEMREPGMQVADLALAVTTQSVYTDGLIHSPDTPPPSRPRKAAGSATI